MLATLRHAWKSRVSGTDMPMSSFSPILNRLYRDGMVYFVVRHLSLSISSLLTHGIDRIRPSTLLLSYSMSNSFFFKIHLAHLRLYRSGSFANRCLRTGLTPSTSVCEVLSPIAFTLP
jgi:hypothetical protein